MSLKVKIYNAKVYLSAIRNQFWPDAVVRNNGHRSVYISYLIDPFKKKSKAYFNSHQSRRESLQIAKIFESFNLTVIIQYFNARIKFPKKKYDFIFGLEPNFVTVSKRNPKAVKIYYATCCYYKHQNNSIVARTDQVISKYGTQYPYYRLLPDHNACEIADYIIQIGSKFTLDSYPHYLKDKIILIAQSTYEFKDFDLSKKKRSVSRKDYIWMGGGGSILKGLDLVLEYFIINTELNLHVVGRVDDELAELFSERLAASKNIKLYGFLDIASPLFRAVADKGAFMIYPSSSEAGAPGSVISLQKLGVIPLVSKWAAFEEINMLGYAMNEVNFDEVSNAITWSLQLSTGDFEELISKNHLYATEKNSMVNFEAGFKSALLRIMKAKRD